MLDIGNEAPSIGLPDQDGTTVDLTAFEGRWVLLYWYPKADTPGCTVQAKGLRDQATVFDAQSCTIIGASFDPQDDLLAFRDRYGLPFSLVSDLDRSVGQAYGVAGEDGTGKYADRIAYLIDPTGRVARRYEVDDPQFFADTVLDDLAELGDGVQK